MPHCDCHLYNNLLKANWGPHQLHKIAILGIPMIPPVADFPDFPPRVWVLLSSLVHAALCMAPFVFCSDVLQIGVSL